MQTSNWIAFLLSYCDIELEEILLSDGSLHTLLIDGHLLLDYDLQLCSSLQSKPRAELQALKSAAIAAQTELLDKHKADPDVDKFSVKTNVHVRLHNLPSIPELVRNRVPTSGDIGKYLLVNGTVIRTSSIKVLERDQMWRCTMCQGIIELEGKFELKYKCIPPTKCSTETCRGYKFQYMSATMLGCSDYQEITIQEKVERLDMGTIPRSMKVVLEHDLVDTCKAGDDVTIYGVVSQMWDNTVSGVRCSLETVFHANYLEIHNEQHTNLDVTDTAISRHYSHWRRYSDNPINGRNLILASFCPDVYQLYMVKLAALLVMLGGVTHTDGHGTKVRGECHLLLVGDPGTGKSQILKYASKLSPRSVITTGIGCTTAGLTVAAVKDGGEWALEAGAMVLADGGICCIDELSSIRETDRVAIHEAMEQQTISVAKAGLVCKLNTRTTVLAATNPRGKYDISQPISTNVPIGTPLLSRFDLILVLFDDHTPSWDGLVAGFLLQEESVLEENNILKNYPADVLWTFEELRQYVCHVKSLKPKLSIPAKEVLGRYYRLQREQLTRNVSRTTIRMLESLVRLSQAHAKLMMRDSVTLQDAIVTISLVESTMLNSALLGAVSVLHSIFPADPQLEYNKQKSLVLEVLNLPPDFGESEETGHHSDARESCSNRRRYGGEGIVGEVPSFHVNTQELRRQIQANNRQSTPTKQSTHPNTSMQSKVLKQTKLKHRVNDKVVFKAPETSQESAASTPPKKQASFAELIRNHKAKKRVACRSDTSPNKAKKLANNGAEQLSNTLIERTTELQNETHESHDKVNSLPRDDLAATIHAIIGDEDGFSNIFCSSRNTTPLTPMFNKFNFSQKTHVPPKREHVSEKYVVAISETKFPNTAPENNDPNKTVDESPEKSTEPIAQPNVQKKGAAGAPLDFTPYINTQKLAVTSSIKPGSQPPLPPHFTLSPVPLETGSRGGVVSRVDEVTEKELQAKTKKPQQKSAFHSSSAEKLKKFVFHKTKR